jgi:hypothetical protein
MRAVNKKDIEAIIDEVQGGGRRAAATISGEHPAAPAADPRSAPAEPGRPALAPAPAQPGLPAAGARTVVPGALRSGG